MVSIVKLNNNVEVIGKVVQETHEFVVVEDPFTINYMFSPKSEKPVIGLLRYMPFAESRRIKFGIPQVLNLESARNSMAGYYKSVLQSYVEEIDKSIDNELESISELNNTDVNSAEMMAAFMERINMINSKIH